MELADDIPTVTSKSLSHRKTVWKGDCHVKMLVCNLGGILLPVHEKRMIGKAK